MAYMMSIRLLARAPIMIILSWMMTLKYSVTVALLFLIVIPLLGGTLMFIAKKAHPHFITVFNEYDVLNNSVQAVSYTQLDVYKRQEMIRRAETPDDYFATIKGFNF